ncbi:MAG: hypothetical protein HUK23_04510 [Sphaerochaetaceae bacterium]|nr:hypothetical protein [Sphaerochaetaceae bacterium]
MKKAFVIITLLMTICFALVAESGDALQVNATIALKQPEFTIKGGIGNYDTPSNEENVSNVITSSDDISEKPITVNVKVYQTNKAKSYASFNITIEASALSDGTNSTANPSTGATTSPFSGDNATDRLEVTPSVNTNKAIFAMDYKNGKPVNPNGTDMEVGATSFTWAKSEDLPAGNYSASITITYSVQ